jgi:hypothetical protein
VDRAVVEDLGTGVPDARAAAQAERAFLIAAVHAMAGAGIRQFIDLRCGLPRDQNVHDAARARCPDAVIVYVDSDPVVIAHVRALTTGTDDRIAVVDRDFRDPEQVLAHPRLHAVIDTQPRSTAHGRRVAVPRSRHRPGRCHPLRAGPACRQLGSDQRGLPGPGRGAGHHTVERLYAGMRAPVYLRSRAEIEQLFGGLRLTAPGLTDLYRTDPGRHRHQTLISTALRRSARRDAQQIHDDTGGGRGGEAVRLGAASCCCPCRSRASDAWSLILHADGPAAG